MDWIVQLQSDYQLKVQKIINLAVEDNDNEQHRVIQLFSVILYI